MPASVTIVCLTPFAKGYRDELSWSAGRGCSEDMLVPTYGPYNIRPFSWAWVRFCSPNLESPKLRGTRHLQKKRRNVELKNTARIPFCRKSPFPQLGVISRREAWMLG